MISGTSEKMKVTSTKLTAVQLAAVITTSIITIGICAWYIAQFILSIPILPLLLAISTTIAIILAEIIFISWLIGKVRQRIRKINMEYRQAIESLPALPILPPLPTTHTYTEALRGTGDSRISKRDQATNLEQAIASYNSALNTLSSYAKDLSAELVKVQHEKNVIERQLADIQPSITTFPFFAIVSLSIETDEKALIGKTYSVFAGASQNKPEGFQGQSFDIAASNTSESLSLDVLFHGGENIKLISEDVKPLEYNPHHFESQLVEFTFQAVALGHCAFDIHFYHERHWLTTIQMEFEAIEKPQQIAVSSEE